MRLQARLCWEFCVHKACSPCRSRKHINIASEQESTPPRSALRITPLLITTGFCLDMAGVLYWNGKGGSFFKGRLEVWNYVFKRLVFSSSRFATSTFSSQKGGGLVPVDYSNPEHTTKNKTQASRGSPAPSLFTRSTHAGPPESHFSVCHKQVNAHTLSSESQTPARGTLLLLAVWFPWTLTHREIAFLPSTVALPLTFSAQATQADPRACRQDLNIETHTTRNL